MLAYIVLMLEITGNTISIFKLTDNLRKELRATSIMHFAQKKSFCSFKQIEQLLKHLTYSIEKSRLMERIMRHTFQNELY